LIDSRRPLYLHGIYTLLEVTMSTVQKWGNSLAIRIPRTLAGQLDVAEGAAVELHVRDGDLVVRPVRSKKLSLGELLKSCRPSQLHGETDFGPDVGREVVE
jgi:antitoxin MazE